MSNLVGGLCAALSAPHHRFLSTPHILQRRPFCINGHFGELNLLIKTLDEDQHECERIRTELKDFLQSIRSVDAAGVEIRVDVTVDHFDVYLIPLALFLIRQSKISKSKGERFLCGITAGAGAGKTVISKLLTLIIAKITGEAEFCAAVSIDAYHRLNTYLDSHNIEVSNGEVRTMRSIKGSPPTFDVVAFVSDLQQLRTLSNTRCLPIYDRAIHEPVPNKIIVASHVSPCIVVEGLFLLRNDEDEEIESFKCDYDRIRPQLDFCVMLRVPIELAKQRLTERKLRTGRTREEADAAFDRVDRINHVKAELEQRRADLTLTFCEPGNTLASFSTIST